MKVDKEKLDYIVKTVIENKSFNIAPHETINLDTFVEKRIVVKKEHHYELVDFSIVAPKILKEYGYKKNDDLKESFKRIEKIENHLLENGWIYSFNELRKELVRTIILNNNFKVNEQLTPFLYEISSLQNEVTDIHFDIFSVYNEEILNLPVHPKNLILNSQSIFDTVKSDADYNGNESETLLSIAKKVKQEGYDYGIDAYRTSNKSVDSRIKGKVISTLALINKKKTFKEVVHYEIKNGVNVDSVLIALSSLKELEKDDCEYLLKLFEKFVKNKDLVFHSLALLFNVIRSDTNDFDDRCFQHLTTFLNEKETGNYIISNLFTIDGYSQKINSLWVNLISRDYFELKVYKNSLNSYLYSSKFDCFKEVAYAIIKSHPFKKIAFQRSHIFKKYDKQEFELFLIEMLTSNSAAERFLGNDIFEEISKEKNYEFTVNILQLAPLVQYKLWVSLLTDVIQPYESVHPLTPLLSSKSEFVRESFLCKLEEMSEDYGYLIVNNLETNLDSSTDSKLIVERLRTYRKEFSEKNIEPKMNITEFNPNYTFNREMRLYYDKFRLKMEENLNFSSGDFPILDLVSQNRVHLAKGGGWKMRNKEEVSQLSKISSSFPMPRGYYIYPTEYDLSIGVFQRTDWEEVDFFEVTQILENE